MREIKYNPYEPGDFQKQYIKSLNGDIKAWFFIGILIYYIWSLTAIFKGQLSIITILPFVLLPVTAVYSYVRNSKGMLKDEKNEYAKFFFLIFFCCFIDIACIVAFFVSIGPLKNESVGLVLRICGIVVFVIITMTTILFFLKEEGFFPVLPVSRSFRLFTDKKTISIIENDTAKEKPFVRLNELNSNTYHYCHKCGKELMADSNYCSACGTKLSQ